MENESFDDKLYDNLISDLISNDFYSNLLNKNIIFVEKYLDKVDSVFLLETERIIVYRQLGSIVFSTIEGLVKYILLKIFEKCNNRGCNENNCPYLFYKDMKSIEHGNVYDIIRYLNESRLFYFPSDELERFSVLKDFRNFTHVSRSLFGTCQSANPNKYFVEELLKIFYKILCQFENDYSFFEDELCCLKELDCNEIKNTREYSVAERKSHNIYEIYNLFDRVFDSGELNHEDEVLFAKINNPDEFDMNDFVNVIAKLIYFHGPHYHLRENIYEEKKNDFVNTISRISGNKKIKSLIKHKLNELKKTGGI